MKKYNSLFAILLIFWGVRASACQNENDLLPSKDAEQQNLGLSENILTQKTSKRQFSSNTLELITQINFETLDKPPFRPGYLAFDEKGALYTVDFSDFYIHKFSPFKEWMQFKHSYFGKGIGQGPGELSRVLDFKIFKYEIYLVDEGTGSIEVYSTDGTYKKRIKLSNHLIPRKITLQDDKIIVESSAMNEPLLFVYDLSGNLIFAFGKLINKTNKKNPIYEDNALSDSFSGNCFYYLPRFLGFVGMYRGDKLVMARETIDGLEAGKKNVPIDKTVMKGVRAQTVSKKYETVLLHALHKDFILIKAYDYEQKKSFWDIYTLSEFDYLMSIVNPPKSQYFAIHGNYLAALAETEIGSEIRIFDMTKLINEIWEQKGRH